VNRPDDQIRPIDVQQTDEELTLAAMRGDADAFGILVVRLRSAVIGYVAGLIGNRDEAEEIAQEAFLAAWKNLPSLRQPAYAGTWIFRIAHNLSTKRGRRLSTVPLTFDPAVAGPDTRRQERLLGVLAVVGRLSDEHRDVVMRKHFGGYSGRQIAEQLNIAPGTVRSRLSRAYAEMRSLLEAETHENRAMA